MFDKTTETNLLYDFYAQLLTEKQREVTRLYYCENLSLSEIGNEFLISRQGVHDALKNAEKAFFDYESKLGLLKKFAYTSSLIDKANKQIDSLISENAEDKDLAEKIYGLKEIIDELATSNATSNL